MRALVLTAALAALAPAVAAAQPPGWRVSLGMDAATKRPTASALLMSTRGNVSLVLNCGTRQELRAAFVLKTPSQASSIVVQLDGGKPSSWFAQARTARGTTLVYVTNPVQFVAALTSARTMVVKLPQDAAFEIPAKTRAEVQPVLGRCPTAVPARGA